MLKTTMDMTKIAIILENITPFGEIFHAMDIFLVLDWENEYMTE